MKKYAGYVILSIIFLLLLLLFYCYCVNRHSKRSTTVARHWLSWNVFFNPGPMSGQRQNDIQTFENYITAYVHGIDPSAIVLFELNHCPCDTLLTNIDATLVTGSGTTYPPPPSKPNPVPSGDYILADNLELSIPDYQHPDSPNAINQLFKDTATDLIARAVAGARLPRKLAVIDTGLDTLTFNIAYPLTVWNGNLLWQDRSTTTLFNVVPNELNQLIDDNPVRHGTAVTSIALNQIFKTNSMVIPQIMSIRAFDNQEKGSIYSASCALSYAIQQHADYINASWGYYGKEDEVLKYYIKKADSQNIRILAAAGNTPGHHESTDVCSQVINNQNDLNRLKGQDSLFYPACFAPGVQNVVSVTQLNQINTSSTDISIPCNFQNYSGYFITVGVVHNTPPNEGCCKFNIPFLNLPIEGSSFATPTMTGLVMSASEMLTGSISIKAYITLKARHTSPPKYTERGNYFTFPIP
jgi:hypothetical protein